MRQKGTEWNCCTGVVMATCAPRQGNTLHRGAIQAALLTILSPNCFQLILIGNWSFTSSIHPVRLQCPCSLKPCWQSARGRKGNTCLLGLRMYSSTVCTWEAGPDESEVWHFADLVFFAFLCRVCRSQAEASVAARHREGPQQGWNWSSPTGKFCSSFWMMWRLKS